MLYLYTLYVRLSELYQICLILRRGKLCPSQDNVGMSKLAQNRAIPIILDRIIHKKEKSFLLHNREVGRFGP